MSAATWKLPHAGIPHRTGTSSGPGSCCTRPRARATTTSRAGWAPRARWTPSGASGSATSAWPGSATCHGEGGPRPFPPDVVVAVKALACELPAATGVPLARWHCPDLARAATGQGIVASVSGTTIWRWLSADAIKPWRVRSRIFPRDPAFAAKAGRVLDLYARTFGGQPLGPDDYVLSADEKTSIQARIRRHPQPARRAASAWCGSPA